jgi:hypothetical protein
MTSSPDIGYADPERRLRRLLWMLPLGFMLLADDIPPLRRFRDRALDWLERRRPNWFAAAGRATATETPRG